MPEPYFTTETFRALTRVKQSRLGVDASQGTIGEDLLQAELDRAATYVELITGQPATDTEGTMIPPSMATPSNGVSDVVLRTLIGQAVQMRCEQVLFQAQNGYIDDASDDVVTSLSVGGFSQSKSDPHRRGETKSLNTWSALDHLLWMLMTQERYDYWVYVITGVVPPAWAYENMIWPDHGSLLAGGWGYGGWLDGGDFSMGRSGLGPAADDGWGS